MTNLDPGRSGSVVDDPCSKVKPGKGWTIAGVQVSQRCRTCGCASDPGWIFSEAWDPATNEAWPTCPRSGCGSTDIELVRHG